MDGDSETTESERHWLLAPVVCTLLLMAGVVAGGVRALRLMRSSSEIRLLPRCRWLTARWAVRVSAWGALVAGLMGMIYAGRRFEVHWPLEAQVPLVIKLCMALSYCLMILSLLLAFLGLRVAVPEARRAFRQTAKSSLLAGLAAGLATEVLCDAGEPDMPIQWRQSCAMLGGSCGLLLLGLVAASADGQAEREALENLQQSRPARRDLEAEQEAPRHDTGSSVSFPNDSWMARPPWPNWSTARPPEMDWSLPAEQASLQEEGLSARSDSLREPLMGPAYSPLWMTRPTSHNLRGAAPIDDLSPLRLDAGSSTSSSPPTSAAHMGATEASLAVPSGSGQALPAASGSRASASVQVMGPAKVETRLAPRGYIQPASMEPVLSMPSASMQPVLAS